MLASVARSLRSGTPFGASYWSDLSVCPRRFYYQRIERLFRRERNDEKPEGWAANGGGRLGGSLLHATLAAFYDLVRVGCGVRPDDDHVRPEFEAARDYLEADPNTESVVWRMFQQFRRWELSIFQDMDVIGVEVPFKTEIDTGVILTSRSDVIMQNRRTGEVFGVDWKLCSSERGSIQSSFRLSPTITTTILCSSKGAVWNEKGSYANGDGPDIDSYLPLNNVFLCQIFTRKEEPFARAASLVVPQSVIDAYASHVASLGHELARIRGRSHAQYVQAGLVNGACTVGSDRCIFLDLCENGNRFRDLYMVG